MRIQSKRIRLTHAAGRATAILFLLSPVATSQSMTRAWWTSGHSGSLSSVSPSDDGLRTLTTSHDGTARLWEPVAPNHTVLPGPLGRVDAGDLRRDGSLAAYGDQEGSFFLYDPSTKALVSRTEVAEGTIRGLRFSANGSLVTSAGDFGAVVRSASTGNVVRTLFADEPARAVDSGLGNLAVVARGTKAEIWDISTGTVSLSFDAGEEVTDVAVNDAGTRVAAYAGASGLKVWDTGTSQLLMQVPDVHLDARCIEISTDGSVVLLGDAGGNIYLFASSTGMFLASVTSHIGGVSDLRMVGSHPYFVTGGQDGMSWGWDPTTLQPIGQISELSGFLWTAGASIGGRLVQGGSAGTVTVKSSANGSVLKSIVPQDQSSVAWTPYGTHPINRAMPASVDIDTQGARILVGGVDGHLKFFDFSTGNRTFSTSLTTSMVTAVRSSFDGKTAFAATLEGAVSAWNTANNANRWTVSSTSLGSVHRLACSVDNTRVAATGSTGRVEVFNAANGQSVASITDMPFEPTDVALSTDGSKVIVCDAGGTVAVWAVGGTTPLFEHEFMNAEARALGQFIGQDRFLAASENGDVVLIDLAQSSITAVSVNIRASDVVGIAWTATHWLIFDRNGVSGYTATNL